MPNMSYCRFQNTRLDLRDCVDNFHNIDSEEEHRARQRLVALAKQIVDLYESDPAQVDEKFVEVDDEEDEG